MKDFEIKDVYTLEDSSEYQPNQLIELVSQIGPISYRRLSSYDIVIKKLTRNDIRKQFGDGYNIASNNSLREEEQVVLLETFIGETLYCWEINYTCNHSCFKNYIRCTEIQNQSQLDAKLKETLSQVCADYSSYRILKENAVIRY